MGSGNIGRPWEVLDCSAVAVPSVRTLKNKHSDAHGTAEPVPELATAEVSAKAELGGLSQAARLGSSPRGVFAVHSSFAAAREDKTTDRL